MSKINIQKKVIQEIKSHLADPVFVKRTKDIKERAIKAHMDLGEVDPEVREKVYIKSDEEINELMFDYHINPIGRLVLEDYIFFNNFDRADELINLFHLSTNLYFIDDYKNNDFVNIQITKHTTIDDIKNAWPKIQRKFNKKKKRIKEKKNLDRDLKILNLKQKGLSSSEIVKKINAEENNSIISYDYVSKIIKRLKN